MPDSRPDRPTPPPRRRIFIGDVHGCREELEALLEAVRYDPAGDALHPVGDLVNRGPDSVGALRVCREAGMEPVLGNHEVHMLRQWKDPRWRGRRDTLEAILAEPDGAELMAWIETWPLVRGWDDVVLLHAGVRPTWDDPLRVLEGRSPYDASDDEVEFSVRARYCDPEGRTPGTDWPPPPAPFVPWDEFWRARVDETRTVVFGHWARRGLVELPRTRGLDGGCLYGGELTAWIAEEDRFVRVPARRVWYETA